MACAVSALDINELSTVVGSADTDTLSHAFIRNADSIMEDLNDLVTDPQWVLTSAAAINELGDIVGTGLLNGQSHGFLLLNGSVPPPPPGNEAPVATADADVTSGRAPLPVNFTSAGSYDPDGDNITYLWDFGDGSTPSAEANPTHTYAARGTYVVVLTVTDGHGLSSDSAPLEIRVRRKRK